MAVDLLALKNECLNDPTALGLTAPYNAGQDSIVADLLNRVRNAINIPRSDVSPQEVIEAIRITDFVANATTIQSSWFESFTQLLSVRLIKTDNTDTRVLTNLLGLLVNGSASETRLRAVGLKKGSRIEQLFGEFEFVTVTQVSLSHSA